MEWNPYPGTMPGPMAFNPDDYESGTDEYGTAMPPNPYMQQQIIGMMLNIPGMGAWPSPMAPSFTGPEYANIGQTIPVGEDQIEYEAKGSNLYQDQQDIMFSPENAMLAGPGAFDPATFEDIVDYEVVDQPGHEMLRQFLARDPETGQPMTSAEGNMVGQDSWGGMVAEHIFSGGSASTALAEAGRRSTTSSRSRAGPRTPSTCA